MRGLTILGATGTIGVNTLDVVSRHPDRFRVVALTASTDVDRLLDQCLQWRPDYAVMADSGCAERLAGALAERGAETQVLGGPDALVTVATLPEVDTVMAAIVGGAGLLPTLAAADAGKRVLLANKEALVMSGPLFMEAVRRGGAELLPIDSEHNAIFQCLPASADAAAADAGMRRILLTGSGGPFRTRAPETLDSVTPDEACAHPNWVMGRKISVDSATMMNKGLEVIEACWLFGVEPDRIQVVIHPQSVVHSMVEYVDGSVLAQLGHPDMRTPIAHALCWPDRIESGVGSLDLIAGMGLSFEAADPERFPCLRLGYEAAREGGAASAVLNAANEVAVASFLDKRLRFLDIAPTIEHTLGELSPPAPATLEAVLEIDARARAVAGEHVARLARRVA